MIADTKDHTLPIPAAVRSRASRPHDVVIWGRSVSTCGRLQNPQPDVCVSCSHFLSRHMCARYTGSATGTNVRQGIPNAEPCTGWRERRGLIVFVLSLSRENLKRPTSKKEALGHLSARQIYVALTSRQQFGLLECPNQFLVGFSE